MSAVPAVTGYPVDSAGGYILSRAEIEGYRSQGNGKPSTGGIRFFCPIHGGDSQRSFELDPTTGRFKCHNCQAWGYTTEARELKRQRYLEEQGRTGTSSLPRSTVTANTGPVRAPLQFVQSAPVTPARDPEELFECMTSYMEALPGSIGEQYLHTRRISTELALRYGVGYAAASRWPGRHVPRGRIVFPHFAPPNEDGPFLVNLYGRAVEDNGQAVDGALRHDHLAGSKGYFNRSAVDYVNGGPAVYVCEGSFDALALIAAGFPRALAIFGLDKFRWEWLPATDRVVLAFDADGPAERRIREIIHEAAVLGRDVVAIDPAVFGGAKDASEAWRRGTLDIEAIQRVGVE